MGKGGWEGPTFWSTLDGPSVPGNIPVSPKTQERGSIMTPVLQTVKLKPLAQTGTTHQEAVGVALVSGVGLRREASMCRPEAPSVRGCSGRRESLKEQPQPLPLGLSASRFGEGVLGIQLTQPVTL